MKLILPFLLILSTKLFAQSADFILLKHKGRTLQTFYAGTNISFTSTNGNYVNARINGIKKDTLHLQEFVINYIPTTLGTYIVDTAGSYHYKYHYGQIASLGPKESKKFNMRGSGANLLGGGILLTLGSGVVFLADREKFSAPLMGAAMALGTLGYFMAKGGNKGMVIGKKYQLVYMDMSVKQP